LNSKVLFAVASMVVCAVGALPAAAQDNTVYVGASFGAAKAKHMCIGVESCDSREPSFGLFGGYELSRHLAVEGGYQYFGTFTRGERGVFSSAANLVAVASLPFSKALSVYVKAGGYLARTHSAPASEGNSGFVYGLGAEWALSKNWSVRGEGQRYSGVGGGGLGFTTDIDVLSAAVVWRAR
jgi:OOP family OmpA-OmpF porin